MTDVPILTITIRFGDSEVTVEAFSTERELKEDKPIARTKAPETKLVREILMKTLKAYEKRLQGGEERSVAINVDNNNFIIRDELFNVPDLEEPPLFPPEALKEQKLQTESPAPARPAEPAPDARFATRSIDAAPSSGVPPSDPTLGPESPPPHSGQGS